MKLWGGNYEAAPDAVFWEFNQSFPFDRRLLSARRSPRRGRTSAPSRAAPRSRSATRPRLERGLGEVLARRGDATPPTSRLDLEDVHSFVEARLGEIVGELAGQAHLGRSRNEQTVTALRLWIRGDDRPAARGRAPPWSRPSSRRAGRAPTP